jgi:hypothetical protein
MVLGMRFTWIAAALAYVTAVAGITAFHKPAVRASHATLCDSLKPSSALHKDTCMFYVLRKVLDPNCAIDDMYLNDGLKVIETRYIEAGAVGDYGSSFKKRKVRITSSFLAQGTGHCRGSPAQFIVRFRLRNWYAQEALDYGLNKSDTVLSRRNIPPEYSIKRFVAHDLPADGTLERVTLDNWENYTAEEKEDGSVTIEGPVNYCVNSGKDIPTCKDSYGTIILK